MRMRSAGSPCGSPGSRVLCTSTSRVTGSDLIPGAEPSEQFAARVRAGVETVAEAAGEGTIAVAVTHSAVIAEFCSQVTGSQPFAFLHNSNGSLTRLFRMPDRRWILVSFNLA